MRSFIYIFFGKPYNKFNIIFYKSNSFNFFFFTKENYFFYFFLTFYFGHDFSFTYLSFSKLFFTYSRFHFRTFSKNSSFVSLFPFSYLNILFFFNRFNKYCYDFYNFDFIFKNFKFREFYYDKIFPFNKEIFCYGYCLPSSRFFLKKKIINSYRSIRYDFSTY